MTECEFTNKAGERIRRSRICNHLTQSDVAKHLGVGKQAVYKYETGAVANIPLKNLEKMAALFHTSPAYLAGWSDSCDSSEVAHVTIGEIISNRRKDLGLTLEDVGGSVGVDRATVMRWEKGLIQKIGQDKIESLSRVLGLDPVLFVQSHDILPGEELRLLSAYRAADPKYQALALELLEEHPSGENLV